FVKCKESAEEIVEDVFISVWNKRENLPDISNLRTYLYVAVKNISLNYLQRRGYPFEDLDQLDVSLISFSPTPEHIIVASEMLQAINKAISELPPRCRIIYKLVKEDGLRYKEVADILQISPRTVENHIATALHKIAREINIDLKTTAFKRPKTSE
ncbi:MAG: RNA polymerase sigma factor, partial [Chitinophagaceae bacterium]